MLLPLHLKQDDMSVAACRARLDLYVDMRRRNPKGFRQARSGKHCKGRAPVPSRLFTMAVIAQYGELKVPYEVPEGPVLA